MLRQPWTQAEVERLTVLRTFKTVREIAAAMGRGHSSIGAKLAQLRDPSPGIKPRAFLPVEERTQPNAQAIEDMHRRNALEYPTITAALMGDPIIGSGRSALEKMSRS